MKDGETLLARGVAVLGVTIMFLAFLILLRNTVYIRYFRCKIARLFPEKSPTIFTGRNFSLSVLVVCIAVNLYLASGWAEVKPSHPQTTKTAPSPALPQSY